MNGKKRLIVAMDMKDENVALELAEKLKDHVYGYKVNYPLALSCGMEIVEKLSAINPVICDFKVADIPNTNRLIVEEVFGRGAKGVIVHGFVGRDAVKTCVDTAKGNDVFVVAEMSHPGGKEFTQPIADKIVEVAIDAGASGIIAPATRPERIAHFRSLLGNLKIIATGVGAQGGSAKEAIKAGADYIIVGRRIYNADNPVEEAEKIIAEMKD